MSLAAMDPRPPKRELNPGEINLIRIYSKPTNNNYNLDNGGYVGAIKHGSAK